MSWAETLEGLLARATGGKWVSRRGYVLIPFEFGEEIVIADCAEGDDRFDWAKEHEGNAALIVALRNRAESIVKLIRAAEEGHCSSRDVTGREFCGFCSKPWPCPVAAALAEIEGEGNGRPCI